MPLQYIGILYTGFHTLSPDALILTIASVAYADDVLLRTEMGGLVWAMHGQLQNVQQIILIKKHKCMIILVYPLGKYAAQNVSKELSNISSAI